MAPYIYMERNGIHIINLYKTAAKLEEATAAIQKIASSGEKSFCSHKKNKPKTLASAAQNVNMPYITERWPEDAPTLSYPQGGENECNRSYEKGWYF